jgi:hypothetical protein
MTAPYQVFVEGPKDRSAGAVAALAAAMGARYGLKPVDLEIRLMRGRFKVKAGIDRATAEEYARDLDRLGAICTVVDASGATVEVRVAAGSAARPGGEGLRPQASGPARSQSSPLPPRESGLPPPRSAGVALPARPVSKPLVSGLAAAKAGGQADLGALGRDDAIALSSLDGEVEATIEPTSLLPASFGPAATPAPPAAKSSARVMTGPPVDLFAAPEGEAEIELALDVPERPTPTSLPATARAASEPAIAPPVVASAARAAGPSPVDAVKAQLANPRIRFAAGVVIALLIGFIPAHVIASVRERAAFSEIDHRLHDRQAAVQSMEEYEQLDKVRARALERKYDERRDIALTAILIWAGVAAAIAYVWFRRVPWDRVAPPQP